MGERTLADLQAGEVGIVAGMAMSGSMRRRIQDIGCIAGTPVECVGKSPLGDPAAYLIRGTVIALRSEESKKILID